MRRLLAGLLFLVASQAHAAIAFVQTAVEHDVGLTTHKTQFASSVTAGDVIGIFVMTQSVSSAAPTSVVDTNGDTPIAALTWTNPGTGEGSMGVWLFVVGTGGASFGVTTTFAASTTWSAIVFEYSGVNTSSPQDGSASTVGKGSGATATAGSTLTPAQTSDQQLAFLGSASGVTVTWNNSLTQENAQPSGIPNAYFADRALSGTSAVTASAGLGAGGNWNMAQILLAPAGGGGGSCTHNGWTSVGAASAPTSGVTSVWLSTRAFGTVNCSSTNYWQIPGGIFGTN